MTATASGNNGKEADFQLFMALLDGDRFEGKFRDGVHVTDTSDLMRRLVKEQLLKFDGTPLFPERIATTASYKLSDAEADLYKQVTDYVREEFNRADALENGGQKGTVGFALTILQRRLASSPEAIFQSLRRRKERLQKRLREEQLNKRATGVRLNLNDNLPTYDSDDLDELDDAPDAEIEAAEDKVVDQASAARTIAELQTEIEILQRLESLAMKVRQSNTDKKWDELSRLLQNNSEMFDAHGHRRKLVIFTEHRDTLSYLTERIRGLLGKPEAVVNIHGGMGREERKNAQEGFTHDKEVEILVATDAAGEGINLQRAHLMVNYDLPWNPNRLEQRFGRIHRIGQTEVCHLWNLVAKETREGDVYLCLLKKLEEERAALGGQVFDVLGQVTYEDRPLRELLLKAIRYGDSPEVRARLTAVVDKALDRDHLRELIECRALAGDTMDVSRVRQIREEMERADARRLQPHYIAAFFLEAFRLLGGTIHERESKRYEIKHVPPQIRNRDRRIGRGQPILTNYERIAFDKNLLNVPGKPMAAFVCPGHPLLDSTIDITIEKYRDLMKRGAALVDDNDFSEELRILVFLEHSIQDARTDRHGNRLLVSKRLQFVEIDQHGKTKTAGYAPYLDYRPLTDGESVAFSAFTLPAWIRADLESRTLEHATIHIVPGHIEEVRKRKEELVDKTLVAVKDRLTTEINHWDHRANQLKEQELAGHVNARLNSGMARKRADDLTGRLQKRLADLTQERLVSPMPPVVKGAALIVPIGLLRKLGGSPPATPPTNSVETEYSEILAMAAVTEAERRLGHVPKDVSSQNVGYDIESAVVGTGRLRFLEVKGRAAGAKTVTVTKNEILVALNKPDDYILAIVEVDGETTSTPSYVRRPFDKEPDFTVTSVNFDLKKLLAKAQPPS